MQVEGFRFLLTITRTNEENPEDGSGLFRRLLQHVNLYPTLDCLRVSGNLVLEGRVKTGMLLWRGKASLGRSRPAYVCLASASSLSKDLLKGKS